MKTEYRNKKGQYHRLDGPAVIYTPDLPYQLGTMIGNGYEEWWVEDKRHRLDGPAYIDTGGLIKWYINHRDITTEVNEWLKRNNYTYPFDNKTKLLFKLTFGW